MTVDFNSGLRPSEQQLRDSGFYNYDYSTLNKEYDNFSKNQKNVTNSLEKDEFVSPTNKKQKVDTTNDGKFSFWQAAKNFGKGIISPVTVIFKHPIVTLTTLAGISAACFFVPVLTPILTVGFGALSVFHLGKSLYNTGKNIAKRNYDEAERGFQDIGTGVSATALSVFGLKQSAKIAAEAKLASSTGTTALNAAQKAEIAKNVANMGFKEALKENLSLFTSKEGFKALFSQFKPSAINKRWLFLKEIVQKTKSAIKAMKSGKNIKAEAFKNSPEGIRRAALTDEQVQAEATAKFNQAFDELGIPKEQRPKLEFKISEENHGGSYCASKHTLEINPKSYKSGIFEIDDVMMHEATHCKEALLRAGLPKEKVYQIITEDLSNRIVNGEAEQIIIGGSFVGPEMTKAPKLPDAMKHDFVQFAKKHLYSENQELYTNLKKINDAKHTISFNQGKIDNGFTGEIAEATKNIKQATLDAMKSREKISPVIQELQAMIKKYPEFAKQYKNPEEALSALEKYSLSHNYRYKFFINNQVNGIPTPKLSAAQMAEAEKSLRGYIDTIEGNADIAGFRGLFATGKQFDHYQFSPEEVLAQQNGNNFLVKNYKAQLTQMKTNGTLTPEKEAFLTSAIKRAESIIAYKTKGLEYYKLYIKMINNPEDKAIAQRVGQLKLELEKLASRMTSDDIKATNQILGLSFINPSNTLPTISIANN